ncbi:hypothetical protein WM40_26985 [Robbsia andropogonis]|uniref:Uncharacterized protein n=1 Tax=Robbsia andropogonis TaxID=28092 RepID=A0A0F5JSK4_9BURK|nr:hypothetical protein WM40_26985 [Robbsia andropogonis]
MDLIDGLGPVSNEGLAHAVQRRKRLLRFSLRRDKPHRRVRGGLTDGFRVDEVIFIGFDERTDELW